MKPPFLLAAVLLCRSMPAQEADRMAPDTRAEAIEAMRVKKSRHLTPEEPPTIERVLQTIKSKKILERITSGVGGVRARLGGLPTLNGFAAGPEYFRDILHDHGQFRTSLRGSTGLSYLVDAELRLPRLAGDHLFLNLYAVHRDIARIDYYGPGPDSSKNGRSTFRLEDTSFQFRTGVRPVRPLYLGVVGQYLMVNVGPGSEEGYASTDQTFSERTTPGIQRQTDFLQGGAFVQVDWRDNPGGPRTGGNYVAQISKYLDQEAGRYSFNRLDLEAQQYIPFFNRRRVIALRGRAMATDPHRGNVVPFYLQPTLGGSDDLRGFRPYRFYDNASVVMNAEYRWEIFSGLDMALFYDTGRVFHEWRDIELSGLEKSYGFGFRFNVRNDVFLRIDTGFSREGFAIWFKFGNVF